MTMLISVGVFAWVAYGMQARIRHRETFKDATARDIAVAGGIILGIAIIWKAFYVSADLERKAVLREQFVIPDAVELTEFEFEKSGKYAGLHRTRATYRFTDRQFAAYRATLDDAAVWYPKAFDHARYTMAGTYTHEARRWTDLPNPPGGEITAGEWIGREFTWLYELWRMRDIETPENGRIMCYVFEDVSNNPHSFFGREEEYAVSACSQRPKSVRIRTRVLAILDFDRKTLFVYIA